MIDVGFTKQNYSFCTFLTTLHFIMNLNKNGEKENWNFSQKAACDEN